jgi:hypothetical protein
MFCQKYGKICEVLPPRVYSYLCPHQNFGKNLVQLNKV